MARSVYLSIDLDYWKDYDSPNLPFLERVLDYTSHQNISVLLVEEHQHMVDHVNSVGAQVLSNIDYHADIRVPSVRGKRPGPQDFNWVNFVSWRKEGHYVWHYPDSWSLINEIRPLEVMGPFYAPYREPSLFYEDDQATSAWKMVECQENNLDTISLDDIIAVGIAISPDYTPVHHIDTVVPQILSYGHVVN